MAAALFTGRVGGAVAALGIGAAILGGAAVAAADTESHSPRDKAVSSSDSTPGPRRQAKAAVRTVPSAQSLGGKAAATRSSRAAATPTPSANVSAALVPAVTPPNPDATISTRYGTLGQWMINKDGDVADWLGHPYCGAGSTSANCTPETPGAKIMQEPINTIFVVEAPTEYLAQLRLDFALRVSGMGPSCCSSIGYKAIVGTETDPQLPRGGPLGLGILPPLPFGLGQAGLLGLAGIGPAYRDAPFFLENAHLRVFGAESDGNGNWIFTGSVSEENLDDTGKGLLPTHGYESFQQARSTLLTDMLNAGWLTGASDQGMVAMDNAISPDDPTYTTGDHDGLAQVIALSSMLASSPARSMRF